MTNTLSDLLRDFRPTLVFLARFIAFYVVASLLYAAYVTRYEPNVDPVTQTVTRQSAWIVSRLGWEASAHDYPGKATTYIKWQERGIVSVYEGCNSLNVMIVFLSFLAAFGPFNKTMLFFAGTGLAILYVANLARIVLLFFVVVYFPDHSYFVHKYLFTAFIYAIVFGLWVIWVQRYAR